MRGKTGGMRNMGGNGRVGFYKGFLFQSSWELAFIIYHLENHIEFERNHTGFKYEFEGRIFNFYPDFIKNGDYVELKGFSSKRTECKIKDFPASKRLIVLYRSEVEVYLKYCIDKYGKNFAVEVLMATRQSSKL